MKVPNSIPYTPKTVTWPASATPDYFGQVGFIIHDGTIPVFKTTEGKYVDLPDDIAEVVDPMLDAARKDNLAPYREKYKRFSDGIAIYGHLCDTFFFARFLVDLRVAQGKLTSNGDIGMHRAMLMRVMGDVGALHTEYDGNLFMAPSEPVMDDKAFGRLCAKWNGKPRIHCQLRFQQHPVVRCRGALLTDSLVSFNPQNPISYRVSDEQLEDFDL